MQVRCPHCHQPIEVLDESSLREIPCSSCGTGFSLVVDETVSLTTDKPKRLAHFELSQKLGAGAFGTVWKALDTDLDRVVAIKVPRKTQLTEADAEKFFREARAAAQLKHPGIVGVHEVGRENDTIYIVSDYVEGLTLADWLTSKQMSIRESAELLIKVSDAVHEAHERGVVHRDLKPSNIMLDAELNPHVMDFGLAKREAGEITMTVDGQVLGTPAYMAPEQAKGDAHTADRRADIYALGAILFELLTGEKPFRGNMRMLLHQVLNDEAPSPRRLNSSIPRDVETIVLRCLEKDPDKRFQTAADFSQDLQRFLKNEPVKSRPISWPLRSYRWYRRNAVVASLTAAILVVLTIGLAIVGSLWQEAKATAQREFEARTLAEQERKRADQNFEQAQRNLDRANSVVDEFYTEVAASDELLRGTPGTHQLRQLLLQKAYEYYRESFAQQDYGDNSREFAEAKFRLACVQNEIGIVDESMQSFQEAIEALEPLVQQFPKEQTHRSQLAASHSTLAAIYLDTHNLDSAETHYLSAEELYRDLVDEFPESHQFRTDLSGVYHDLGNVRLQSNDVDAAIEQFEKRVNILRELALESPPTANELHQLAITQISLGSAYQTQGNHAEAEARFNDAYELTMLALETHPDNLEFQSTLANAHHGRGNVLRARRQAQEAIADFTTTCNIYQRLAEQNPAVVEYRQRLAMGFMAMGSCYMSLRDGAAAISSFGKVIPLLEAILEGNPKLLKQQEYLAGAHLNRGICRLNTGQFENAEVDFIVAEELLDGLIAQEFDVPRSMTTLGGIYTNLAASYRLQKKFGLALEALQKAYACFDQVLADSPNHQTALRFQANAVSGEIKTLNFRAWQMATSPDETLRDGAQAISDATRACELTRWQDHGAIDTLAAAHAEQGEFERAMELQRQAIELAESAGFPLDDYRTHLELYRSGKPLRDSQE